MAFTRADALAYLASEFSDLALETGLSETDTPAGYGGAIDGALLEYGVAFSDLAGGAVAESDVIAFRALLRYFALLRFSHKLVTRVDIFTEHPSPDVRRSQAVRNVMKLLDEAKVECIGWGYLTELTKNDLDGGVFQRVTMQLDGQEPNAEGSL